MYSSIRRRRRRQRILLLAGLLLLVLAALPAIFALPGASPEEARTEPQKRVLKPATDRESRPAVWEESPETVKGIYLTAPNAASNLDAYVDLIERTELNAVVIDVKDVTGEVMYPSRVALAREIGATRETIPDLKALVDELKERDIYTIARVATFEDDILPRKRPDLAVTDSSTGGPWVNFSGVAWTNPYNREVWKYNAAVAKEAAGAGFDEVQFDYVRFPSDGPMGTLNFGKETYPTPEDAIGAFLEYASGELRPMGVRVAADVFGLAAGDNGAGVGQVVAKLAPHLDVLSPMTYPSHYPAGSYGYPNPNAEPYGVLENSMAEFEEQAGPANPDLELRPWLQDFDYGTPAYGPEEVRAQMQAVYDAGATGWLLWNPANDYTEAALLPEKRKSPA